MKFPYIIFIIFVMFKNLSIEKKKKKKTTTTKLRFSESPYDVHVIRMDIIFSGLCGTNLRAVGEKQFEQ